MSAQMQVTAAAPLQSRTDERLSAHLARVCELLKATDVAVAVLKGSSMRVAACSQLASGESVSFGAQSKVAVTCFAKPITAMLLMGIAEQGLVALDEPLASVFGRLGRQAPALVGGIRVRQLLDHTHGLDGSALRDLVRAGDGFICLEQLLTALAGARTIAAPEAQLFSYGGAGAALAAAIAEQFRAKPYAHLVHELLRDVGRDDDASAFGMTSAADSVCPAFGGKLRLSALDLAHLVHHQIRHGALHALTERAVQFSGWSAGRRAACCGWFDYWNGWYGHNSQALADSIVVRFHPASQVGIVVASRTRRLAHHVLQNLFGRVLPEFLQRWNAVHAVRPGGSIADPLRYVGVFENAALRLVVEHSQAHQHLQLRGESRRPAVFLPPAPQLTMRPFDPPGASHAFRVVPASWPMPSFVQFIAGRDTAFDYLWDGRALWPNARSAQRARYVH